ncbi:hypothetical protein OZX72_00460 [Bifidobacterium sp. ESL0769]|uniref:hypothetical protein n=1 Tax=Bifidobacterium sp. ESL0769 TaxID=2983229 RepID=UPI0023F880F5|nr:hypothetical protein [Bifidobacterium sp. ESL0769]WEV67521.1 hypothetical protein OZX72_00460 [Bifidobacterium sp. ESL0769]
MKKTKKMVIVASFAAACTLFAGVGFASAGETPAPGSTPVVSAQANYNRTALQAQHDRAVGIRNTAGNLSQYTQESWTWLLSDIIKAEAKLDASKDGNQNADGAMSQQDIDQTTSSMKLDMDLGILQAPKAGEIRADAPLQNMASLQSFYNKIKNVARSSYPSATENQWTRFDQSRTYVSWILMADGDQYQITRAYDRLYADTYNIDQNLLPTPPAPAPSPSPSPSPAPAPTPDKKAGLRSAYDKVKDYKQDDFTAASPWAAFAAELAKAKAMLDTDNTQAAFDAEATALNAKADALISIAALKADIAKASSLKPSDYSEFSWYLVTIDLPWAKDVVADANATKDDVSAIEGLLSEDLADLRTPIAGEKTGADIPTTPKTKTDLTKLVAQAETLKQGDYTAASWKVFAEALKDAKDALNPEAQPQSQLLRDGVEDDYTFNYVELEDAQSALVRNVAKTNGAAGAAGKKAGLATTGANVSIVAGIMALFAVAGAAIKLVDRKRA